MTEPILNGNLLSDIASLNDKIKTLERSFNDGLPVLDALPITPDDGAEFVLSTAAMRTLGAFWHLKFDKADNVWYFLGGNPIYGSATANVAGTTTGSPASIVVSTPSLVVPLAGSYLISIWAELAHSVAGAQSVAGLNIDTGGGQANDETVRTVATSVAANQVNSSSDKDGSFSLVLGSTVQFRIRPVAAGTATILSRWLEITPKSINPV